MKKLIKIILLLSIIFTGCDDDDCTKNNRSEFTHNGCGDFQVHTGVNETGNPDSIIVIEVERNELELSNKFISFDINENSSISTFIYEYKNFDWAPFCTDMISMEIELIKTWNLKSGVAEIRIVKEKSECDESYVVDLILKEAIFTDNEMNEIFILEKEFKNILVNYPQFDY